MLNLKFDLQNEATATKWGFNSTSPPFATKIQDEAERWTLILWGISVILVSAIGDSIILVATIKYKAIKLHYKLMVAVIQHMAVCDLLQTVFRVIPISLSIMIDRWLTGDLLCHLEVFIYRSCTFANILQTCALPTLKLLFVKFPLKTRPWSSWLGHKICLAMWLLVLVWYTPVLVMRMHHLDTIYFSYFTYACYYYYGDPDSLPKWYWWYFKISYNGSTVLCFLVIIVTSVTLLIVAKKAANDHRERLKWEGVTTALFTVGVFYVSYLPFVAFNVVLDILDYNADPRIDRALLSLQYLNILANIFVYSLTIQSFRNFLKVKICQLFTLPSTQLRQRQLQGQIPLPILAPRPCFPTQDHQEIPSVAVEQEVIQIIIQTENMLDNPLSLQCLDMKFSI